MKYVLRQKGAPDRPCTVDALGEGRWRISLDGEEFTLAARALGLGGYALLDESAGRSVEAWVNPGTGAGRRKVTLFDGAYELTLLNPAAALSEEDAAGSAGAVASPMPGRLVKLLVKAGDAVKAGQPLCVVEAMKMQNELASPIDGVVEALHAREGDQVAGGAPILTVG